MDKKLIPPLILLVLSFILIANSLMSVYHLQGWNTPADLTFKVSPYQGYNSKMNFMLSIYDHKYSCTDIYPIIEVTACSPKVIRYNLTPIRVVSGRPYGKIEDHGTYWYCKFHAPLRSFVEHWPHIDFKAPCDGYFVFTFSCTGGGWVNVLVNGKNTRKWGYNPGTNKVYVHKGDTVSIQLAFMPMGSHPPAIYKIYKDVYILHQVTYTEWIKDIGYVTPGSKKTWNIKTNINLNTLGTWTVKFKVWNSKVGYYTYLGETPEIKFNVIPEPIAKIVDVTIP